MIVGTGPVGKGVAVGVTVGEIVAVAVIVGVAVTVGVGVGPGVGAAVPAGVAVAPGVAGVVLPAAGVVCAVGVVVVGFVLAGAGVVVALAVGFGVAWTVVVGAGGFGVTVGKITTCPAVGVAGPTPPLPAALSVVVGIVRVAREPKTEVTGPLTGHNFGADGSAASDWAVLSGITPLAPRVNWALTFMVPPAFEPSVLAV